MDSIKTVYQRDSTGVLDFIGDYGGFQQCIDMAISIFGTYLSAKFVTAGLAKELYVQRVDIRERKEA